MVGYQIAAYPIPHYTIGNFFWLGIAMSIY